MIAGAGRHRPRRSRRPTADDAAAVRSSRCSARRVEPPLAETYRSSRCDQSTSTEPFGLHASSSRANFARSVFWPTAANRTTSLVSSSSGSTLITVADAELRMPHAHAGRSASPVD